ncbi:HDOD domain-containing protein [Methylobacter sp. Wu8]|uniref:EAL and HDOD domain-containing protein n=1 Tax=Methylobacter sp. Wu8 TaxID=3118457 RepID=UPI002F2E9E21|nr:HDOD domain-containing protein [Methylobacter tundripaludum]
MADIIIGRQQIFDQKLNVCAYELLFRGNDFNLNYKDDAAKATQQVITDTILELGLNTIVGPHKAFINFTTQNILDKTPLHLPKDRIVIEVLENVEIDSRIIANLKELSELGYIIALDDFVFSEMWTPLVEFADIIKLDILEMGELKTRELINRLKPYNVQLLAEKVETYAEYRYLVELGCDYFQGFFFNKPNTVSGKRMSVNQATAIQLLNTANNPDVEFEDMTKIISLDVGLSYKLLHYINSAFFALPNKISSIGHAISYLGLKEMRRWINILMLASLSSKPEAVMQNALIRGKMCEELAGLTGNKSGDFFLIGILSNLDSLLDMPLDEALNQLPLADDIVSAILHKEGLGGEALDCVISYERWDISSIAFKDVDQAIIGDTYIHSINWAKNVMGNIK